MWFYSNLETFVCQCFFGVADFKKKKCITDIDRIDSLALIYSLWIKASKFSMPKSSICNVNLLAFRGDLEGFEVHVIHYLTPSLSFV